MTPAALNPEAEAWLPCWQDGDEVSMSDVAQLITVDSEEDDEDEEDDPDYEPLSMEDDSIQPREMVSQQYTALHRSLRLKHVHACMHAAC